MEFCALKTFDQVPKSISSFLAVDRFFDQLKSVKNFGQLIMKILIN
jgi:hypothetical protein